jgi:phosphomannomutase
MLLFDMDETITSAREVIKKEMVFELIRLSETNKIGIVSGSDISKIKEQLKPLLDKNIEIHIFECNGTGYYIYQNDLKLVKKVTMKEKIGLNKYKLIMRKLLKIQNSFVGMYQFDVSPPFIEDRGSMINWSLVGRNLNLSLNPNLKKDIKVSIGGKTSLDVFPYGWDKTFVFNYVNKEDVIFFGDKCEEGQNDYEIYNSLNENKRHHVSCPEETLSIIKNMT